MFRKYVRFLLTKTCVLVYNEYIETEQTFEYMRRQTKGNNIMRNRTRAQRRRQIVRRKLMFMAVSSLMIVFITGILCGTLFTRATGDRADNPVQYKYYTSIQIEKNDSLWDIAAEYITAEYETVHDYIDEVKQLNSLETDNIREGQYLTIPYYSEEFM